MRFLGRSLADNNITQLPDHVFAGLTSLQHLSLHHNALQALSQNLFSDLTALLSLYVVLQVVVVSAHANVRRNVGANRLIALPPGIFNSQARLTSLYVPIPCREHRDRRVPHAPTTQRCCLQSDSATTAHCG